MPTKRYCFGSKFQKENSLQNLKNLNATGFKAPKDRVNLLPVFVQSGTSVVQRSEICPEIINFSYNVMADIDELMQEGPIDDDDLIEIITTIEN